MQANQDTREDIEPQDAPLAGKKRRPWRHKRDFFILLNPAKRMQLIRRAVAWVLLALVVFECFGSTGLIVQWQRSQADERALGALHADMEMLASAGKPDAIKWLVQHDAFADIHRLAPLIEQGDAEAMMLQARAEWSSDRTQASALVERAAQQGYAPAMLVQKGLATMDPLPLPPVLARAQGQTRAVP